MLLILALPLFSQIDTTSLAFYPLRTHSYWEYNEHGEDFFDFYSWDTYYSVEVLGDTLLPNGKRYKILKKTSLDTFQTTDLYFERIDTAACNVYHYYPSADDREILIDSLKIQAGDTSFSVRDMFDFYGERIYCDSVFSETILGIPTTSKQIRSLALLDVHNYKLSKNFGLTARFVSYDFGYTRRELKYAVINGEKYGSPVAIKSAGTPQIPRSVFLYPNYPNPFNAATVIKFYLAKSEKVELSVYSIDGRLIGKLVSSKMPAGLHHYKWNAADYSSGVYIFRLRAGRQVYQRKCVLVK